MVTNQGLLEDLDYLKEKILKTHPNPFYLTTEEDFNTKFQYLKENGDSFTPEKTFVKVLEIMCSIGDGHTDIWPRTYYSSYPIRFHWFQEDIYVSSIEKENEEFLGSKLLAIDETPIKEVTEKVFKITSQHETIGLSERTTSRYVTIAQLMYGLEISKSKKKITYTLQTPTSGVQELSLEISPPNVKPELVTPFEKDPYYYDNRGSGLWFEEIENDLIYFHFSSYPKNSEFGKIGKELNSLLKATKGKKLFIDLRRNRGGDYTKGQKLIKIIEKTISDQEVPVYVATSSTTYSAAVANAAHFRQRLNATLLGEPTGGRPVGYQETNIFYLPNTNLRGSVSSIYYEFQKEDTPGVLPDVTIPFTWKHYATGSDPVLDHLNTLESK